MRRTQLTQGRIEVNLDTFTDMHDVLNYISTTPTTDLHARRYASQVGTVEFNNGATFEQATVLARDGWPEGTHRMRKLADTFYNRVALLIPRPEIVYDVTGDGGFDMGRVLSGEPECFMDWHETDEMVQGAGNRIVRLQVNIAVSCGVSVTTIERRGAAVAALVELLELAGHRVEVTMVSAMNSDSNESDSSQSYHSSVVIKEAGQPLSLDTLVFALAHAGMFRRLVFALQERAPQSHLAACDWRNGYGYPGTVAREEDQVEVPSMHYHDTQWHNDTTAVAWVLQFLRDQGIEVKEEA